MSEAINYFEYIILGADRWGRQMASLLNGTGRNYLIIDSLPQTMAGEDLNILPDTRICYIDKNRTNHHFELISAAGALFQTRVLLVSHDGSENQHFDDGNFANNCRPQRTTHGLPVISAELQSVNVEGLFFLGKHTAMRDYGQKSELWDQEFQVTMLYRFMEQKFHGIDLCRHTVPHDADTVKNLVHNRMNLANTGWRRPGYIGDFLVVDNNGKMAKLYSQLTSDYFREHIARPEMVYYTLTIADQETGEPGTIVSKCQGWEIISECRLSGDPIQQTPYWNSKVDEIVAATPTEI